MVGGGKSPKLRGGMSRFGFVFFLFTLVSLQAATVLSQGAVNTTDPIEKAALLAFRKALVDPGNVLKTWISTTDPCTDGWNRIYCGTPQPANRTNYRHVTELRLFSLNLGGTLVPDLGNFSGLLTLDVMWNHLTGTIPSTLGNLASLRIMALNGNNLTGPIPPELGNLTNMNRFQLDQNQLSGQLPSSLGGLVSLAHMHFNNNSFSGPIPAEFGRLPNVIHILLDTNNLTGPLPPEIGNAKSLIIIQLDNNQFTGGIPTNYTNNLTGLTKLSCRNCNLSGTIPDLTKLVNLSVIDLSNNSFVGSFPTMDLTNTTVVDFSRNQLVNGIPLGLDGAKALQTLQLSNNQLDGNIPDLTQSINYSSDMQLLDFQNNTFNYINLGLVTQAIHQPNLDLRLSGNSDICTGSQYIVELDALCTQTISGMQAAKGNINNLPRGGPILVKYRLKSPGFSYFTLGYETAFTNYIASGLQIDPSQVSVQSYEWQPGPRLLMNLQIDPPANSAFNATEVDRIERAFSNWMLVNSTFYGPYELLGFYYLGKGKSGLSKGALAGIIVAALAVSALILALIAALFLARVKHKPLTPAQRRRAQLQSMKSQQDSMLKITGVYAFSYKELAQATNNFSEDNKVGRGGYGDVYRGVLESGQIVAIKRANLEAIQRNTEFYNEIELLSRCHHRNLVALVGYCNDEEEQMLVYEFMERGTLHDNLHPETETDPGLDFATRLKLALGSAKGILYLHTEADPPIFHRDIKSNNILLDDKKQAKVADFGLSRLAPDLDEAGLDTISHVSTVVKGTPGYLDPEYFLTRKLTDKSDVYSFGVVLLELITAMEPIFMGKNIVREVRASYDKEEMSKVIDPNMGPYQSEAMDPFIRLAFSCVNSDTDDRPTMQEVTRTLENLVMTTQGKKGLRDVMSMDITGDNYMELLRKSRAAKEKVDQSSSSFTGFDTGSSQNSKYQPDSTTSFMTTQGKDTVSPR